MNVMHSVSTLLHVIYEAEDEQTALRRGCAWLRRHANASAAGILSSDGTVLVAGDGMLPADIQAQDLLELRGP
jgi:hypothetical protein